MKLKAAIVGMGNQTLSDHIPGIKESQFAQLIAICDIDKSKLEPHKELGVRAYTDFKEMFNSENLDFIIAATPHDSYKEILEEAAKRKIHILKEKPFARNLNEATHFKQLADKNKIHLTTTLQRRFNPIYTTFFQLRDQIGKLFFVDTQYNLFVEKPHEGWRGSRERAGGGCIIDMGYHLVDMVIWYFGLPHKVHAEFSSKAKPDEKYDAEDTATVLFSYNDGLHGTLQLSRYNAPKNEKIKVLGSRGIIELERGSIKRMQNDGKVIESLTREQAWPVAAVNQIDYFCRVVKGEREDMGSPAYHLQHMSFIDACYLSQKQGRYVSPQELLSNAK